MDAFEIWTQLHKHKPQRSQQFDLQIGHDVSPAIAA